MLREETLQSANGAKLGEKGLRQRAEILEIAMAMILEQGTENLVLRQIAAQAGIKLGHLQYYFSSREDLLVAIVRTLQQADEAAFIRPLEKDSLSRSVSRILDLWFSRNGEIYSSIFDLAPFNPRIAKMKRLIYRRFYVRLMHLISSVKPRQSKATLLAKAKMITALMDGVLLQVHFGSATEQMKQSERLTRDVKKYIIEIAER